MKAKVKVMVPPGKITPGGILESTYQDAWANTEEELLASYRKWSSAEIVEFKIIKE